MNVENPVDLLNVKFTNLNQIGIVVDDFYHTSLVFESTFRIGPFRIVDWPVDGIDPLRLYHGKSAKWRMRLGYTESGCIKVELPQPLEKQNLFGDFLDKHEHGITNIRFNIRNYEETVNTLREAGLDLLSNHAWDHLGSQWPYFETRHFVDGVLIELRKFPASLQLQMP